MELVLKSTALKLNILFCGYSFERYTYNTCMELKAEFKRLH